MNLAVSLDPFSDQKEQRNLCQFRNSTDLELFSTAAGRAATGPFPDTGIGLIKDLLGTIFP